ncbi:NAD(P)-dependent oxidoreductase, partial [Campylobacter fetus subsp. venerealis]
DVVSLHVDGRPGNAGLFGDEQMRLMKPRSLFLNLSRGIAVDTSALKAHLESGHIAGAALDVFPVEPKRQGDPFESELRGV